MSVEGSVERIISVLEERALGHDIDIVDVEVVGSAKTPVVRVRISDALDEIDVFPGSFTLAVSSPGMDRPLRRVRDFERFSGSQVSLQTTALEGRRRYTGKLLGIQENIVSLESDGMTYDIPLTEIKKCTLKPTFDFSGQNKN